MRTGTPLLLEAPCRFIGGAVLRLRRHAYRYCTRRATQCQAGGASRGALHHRKSDLAEVFANYGISGISKCAKSRAEGKKCFTRNRALTRVKHSIVPPCPRLSRPRLSHPKNTVETHMWRVGQSCFRPCPTLGVRFFPRDMPNFRPRS